MRPRKRLLNRSIEAARKPQSANRSDGVLTEILIDLRERVRVAAQHESAAGTKVAEWGLRLPVSFL
jgi:hypothetical protein